MTMPARLVAFYLPQFHPIPENDEWWGAGFTEWTNARKARPLYSGHYQPHVPADLGYYDLRVAETRAAQAELARQYGIEAFCYYHYWFNGRRLLERPFDEVLRSGQPEFPFCLCWANQSWTGIWHGAPDRTLIEQTYGGPADDERHFAALLPAFRDPRYLRVDGRPVFVVYDPENMRRAGASLQPWRAMAREAGLPGLYLVGNTWHENWQPEPHGYDAAVPHRLTPRPSPGPFQRAARWLAAHVLRQRLPVVYRYRRAVEAMLPTVLPADNFQPCVVPNWDNTPRSGANGLVLHGSTPALFAAHVRRALDLTRAVPRERRLIWIKSWNEWGEGNHLEPDQRFGHAYLAALRDECEREARQATAAAIASAAETP